MESESRQVHVVASAASVQHITDVLQLLGMSKHHPPGWPIIIERVEASVPEQHWDIASGLIDPMPVEPCRDRSPVDLSIQIASGD